MFLRGFFQSQRLYSCHSRNKSVFLQFMCQGKTELVPCETSAELISPKKARYKPFRSDFCSYLFIQAIECVFNFLLFSCVHSVCCFFLLWKCHSGFPSSKGMCIWVIPATLVSHFLKSATKNYCFVLSWIYSATPNIRLPPPFSSSKHFTLAVAQRHSGLTVGHFTSSDGSPASMIFHLLQPGKELVESQMCVIACLCTKVLLKEYLLPYFIHSIQGNLWHSHTGLGGGWLGAPMQMQR